MTALHPARPGIPATETCRICGLATARPRAGVVDRAYLHCERCNGTFVARGELPSPTQERTIYDLHENDPANAGYRRFVSRLVDPMIARLAAGAEGLDYGCGDGPAGAALLREAGFAVTCYDPIFRPDASALARHYDFILCCEVAEHFHDPAGEFARFATLLRPGGLLGIMTSMEYPDTDFASWHYRRDPTHVTFYRPETMDRLAQDHGWELALPVPNVALFTVPD